MRRLLITFVLAALAAPVAALAQAPVPGAAPGGSLQFSVATLGGTRALAAVADSQLRVTGVVRPFVAGQSVLVRVTRGARTLSSQLARVRSADGATGRFGATIRTGRRAGTLKLEVLHAATPLQAQITAPARALAVVAPRARRGSRGPSVRLLQRSLLGLHYALRASGTFDSATARAVEAFRKLTGMARTQQVDSRVFDLLARGAGAFHPRYAHQGNHFEADLTHQVLAEVTSAGHVRRIYPMSSGKPSTPTVIGNFRIYSKTPGTNSHGMVDSNYFIRGYAIHGYAEVPTYAASHGCLRIPIPDASDVYHWARNGYGVDVYTRSGRGSHRVQKNAGP